jgi:predicted ATPase
MTVRMLLRNLKLQNLFSFRNTEVELRGLNVLIGANASGKSNLIEALGLLQAAPVDLSAAILRLGGREGSLFTGGAGALPDCSNTVR